jgi:hypothetical protein
MMSHHESDPSRPWRVLGLSRCAGEDEIRAAYLEQVKLHPPDREPEAFERIRDAYEVLRDPRRRARMVLDVDPAPSIESLLDETPPDRRRVGSELWLAAIDEEHRTGGEP